MESKKQLLEIVEKVGRERQQYLKKLFQNIPESIVKEMNYLEVKKNQNILCAGDPCKTVYIVLKGQIVGLDYYRVGRVYSFADFSKMYIVGDFEIFADRPEYGATIRAAQDCKLLKISASSYLNWIQHDENALFLRLKSVLKILTFERKLDRDYLLMDCKDRLISFLVMLYEKENPTGVGGLKVEMTQTELSDKIGFNIRSVQRSIAALEKAGLISNENGKMRVTSEQYEKMQALLG